MLSSRITYKYVSKTKWFFFFSSEKIWLFLIYYQITSYFIKSKTETDLVCLQFYENFHKIKHSGYPYFEFLYLFYDTPQLTLSGFLKVYQEIFLTFWKLFKGTFLLEGVI